MPLNLNPTVLSAAIGGACGAALSLAASLALAPPSLKLGSIDAKSIFSEQARRLADIKAQSPEMQVRSLADTIESYARAVREVSASYNVVLLDQAALATHVPDYTPQMREKLFKAKADE